MNTPTCSPELLMPAGSLEKLNLAFNYGADAVYAGVPLLSLRARENEFSLEDLAEGLKIAHSQNKKIYFTANIFARNLKLKSFRNHLNEWAKLKPDALIMSDPGLIDIVRETHPEIPIHLSVQANCMNWSSVKFWQKMGISRIILSRELRINEIKEIKDQVPDIELEAFVHGSICIAYSGRCLLSHYMSYRDANQGVCDNSCRYPYKLFGAKDQNSETMNENDFERSDDLYLQDQRDPSQFFPIEEDEHGTYIMNSKDLCLIEHLQELKDAGVCSFKVEGRTKSAFYAAMISKIYRQAIDDMMAGKPLDPQLLANLDQLANRGYHKGFLMGDPSYTAQNYQENNLGIKSPFTGIVTEESKILDSTVGGNRCQIEVKGKMQVGDQIEVISPKERRRVVIKKLYDKLGVEKQAVHPGVGLAYLETNESLSKHSMICRT